MVGSLLRNSQNPCGILRSQCHQGWEHSFTGQKEEQGPHRTLLSVVSQLLCPAGSHTTPFLGLTALALSLRPTEKGSEFSILRAHRREKDSRALVDSASIIRLQCEPTGAS